MPAAVFNFKYPRIVICKHTENVEGYEIRSSHSGFDVDSSVLGMLHCMAGSSSPGKVLDRFSLNVKIVSIMHNDSVCTYLTENTVCFH